MTPLTLSEELYKFSCEQFYFLVELGFEKKEKENQTYFISRNFKYVLSKNRYGEDPQEEIFFLPESIEGPSVYVALQYYLNNYFEDLEKIKAELVELDVARIRISASCKMLKKNSWIFSDPKFMRNPDFLNASEKMRLRLVQRLQEGNFPDYMQLVDYLLSFKAIE